MSIHYVSETSTFFLHGKNVTYAFRINEFDYAEHLYYGAPIGEDDLSHTYTPGCSSMAAKIPGVDANSPHKCTYLNYPTELSFFGTGDYREPTVHVENKSGDRLTELLYDGYEILSEKPKMEGMPSMRGGETLVLHLKDRVNGFSADLYYTVYEDASVIARRVVYRNDGDSAVTLRRAYSFALSLPDENYDILSLYGVWAKERHTERIPMHHGVVSIDSKRATSSAVLNPFIGVLAQGTTETYGEAYGVSLVYSSSYVLKAQGLDNGTSLITGGINDFDFSWKLEKGESFETPEVVIAYSDEGIGGMSRAFHDAFRNHLINSRFVKQHRPIVINNWEGTYFDFTTDKLNAIASAAAGTGIDTFVLDDGWFGKRDQETTGLGDWVVNTKKLRGGLDAVIEHVNSLGMKFGLWFEPEMVSEDSDLFRAHPDYAIGVSDRPRCLSRHQYMLDLTRKEVRDYIVDSVNQILRKHHIEYVKWDYNRNVTEFYSFGREPERQAEFAHRYALGLYDLCERIVEANPDVFFEGCSGGGARFDPGILYYFPQIWTSDDTDAEERTHIQYGTSIVYPLSAISCHVSVVPNHQTGRITEMQTRADIAHLGATGYELDMTRFTDAERNETKRHIEEYRAMEDLVLYGDLFRLDDPMNSNFFSFMLVSKDKKSAHLTAYRRMGSVNNEIKRIKPAGLDPAQKYFVPELSRTVSGSTLMRVGILPEFDEGDFRTKVFHFIAE